MPISCSILDTIRAYHADRQPAGVRRKYRRMAEGAFEFFRGSNFLFAAAWPQLQPTSPGPAVWLCGDLHLENFGAFPTDDGEFCFDINDFDESVIAPCSIDLVRCSTSVLLAAESWKLSPTQGTGMVLAFLDAYRQEMLGDSGSEMDVNRQELGVVAELLKAVRLASRERMLLEYTRRRSDGGWRFRRKDDRVKKLRPETVARIRQAVEEFGAGEGWNLLDAVKRYSGIGSLGLQRYQILVRSDGSREPVMLSLKEAAPSVLRPFADPLQPRFASEAERVVAAQRLLQIRQTAGLHSLDFDGRSYRLRAMIPEENRSSLNRLQEKPRRLREAVAVAGRLTARSQRRGCKVNDGDRCSELREWAAGPALDAVLNAAVRFADWVIEDYRVFVKALRDGEIA